MSDPEGFLTRWSRRKREAEDVAPAAQPETDESGVAPATNDAKAVPTEASDVSPGAAEAKAPEVDLSALPSLESITANTDIRAFMLPGVPAELTRAALRRAWVADPAIRDFVGLAENAWDFTAPDTVPGFASSVPPDVARRLIAGMFSDDSTVSAEPAVDDETATKPDVSATGTPTRGSSADAACPTPDTADAGPTDSTVDVAVHKDEAPAERPANPPRPHGGALPS